MSIRNPNQYDMHAVPDGSGDYAVLPVKKAMSMKNKGFNDKCEVTFDSKQFTIDDLQPWMHLLIWQKGLASSVICNFYVFIWDTREVIMSGRIDLKGAQKSWQPRICCSYANKFLANAVDNHEPLKGKVDADLFKRMALLSFSRDAYYLKYARRHALNQHVVADVSKRLVRAAEDAEFRKACPSDILKEAQTIAKDAEEKEAKKRAQKEEEEREWAFLKDRPYR